MSLRGQWTKYKKREPYKNIRWVTVVVEGVHWCVVNVTHKYTPRDKKKKPWRPRLPPGILFLFRFCVVVLMLWCWWWWSLFSLSLGFFFFLLFCSRLLIWIVHTHFWTVVIWCQSSGEISVWKMLSFFLCPVFLKSLKTQRRPQCRPTLRAKSVAGAHCRLFRFRFEYCFWFSPLCEIQHSRPPHVLSQYCTT